MNKLIQKHWYVLALIGIIIVAFILRFANYGNRWGLAYDQARDVIVAREAIRLHTIPLIGPFSSAGQFVYGPQWFWIIALMSLIYLPSVLTPWIVQTVLFIASILVIAAVGNELFDKKTGLVIALLAAVSPAQIQQSINLTSPSAISIFSILSVYFIVKFIKTNHMKYGFLAGFFIGTAITIHFQATGLAVLLPVALIFSKSARDKIRYLIMGFILPFIPLLIFDLRNNFFETKNITDYFLHGQYNIYIPKRWLTYAGSFLPSQWSNIISGNIVFGYLTMILAAGYFAYDAFRKRLDKPFLVFGVSFFLMIVMLRYYRGEFYDSYLVFLHPFVLLLTAWVAVRLYRQVKLLGIIFMSVLIITSIQKMRIEMSHAENFTARLVRSWITVIVSKYPEEKFAIYDFNYARGDKTLPMVLFLDGMGKIDDRGTKIGLTITTSNIPPPHQLILGDRGSYQIFDLSSSSSAQLAEEGWAFVNPSQIYKSTQEWYMH